MNGSPEPAADFPEVSRLLLFMFTNFQQMYFISYFLIVKHYQYQFNKNI